MFNIEEFRSYNNLAGNLKTHDFNVRIPIPSGLLDSRPELPTIKTTVRTFEFSCESTNFPMTGLETYMIRRYGYGVMQRNPVFPTFGPLQCSFICDKNANVHRYFQEWMAIICNYINIDGINQPTTQVSNIPLGVYELSYRDEYVVDLNLNQFDQTGNNIRSVIFKEAYPIAVGDVNLAWKDQNNLIKIPVVFTYTNWIPMIKSSEPLK